MKRNLGVLSLIVVLVGFAASAAGPYFGIENTGNDLAPVLIFGADFSAPFGSWDLSLDGQFTDPDLMTLLDNWIIDFAAGLDWGQTARFADASGIQTGSLAYGCGFTFEQAFELDPSNYPDTLDLVLWTTTLEIEGYVGPFSAWIGCDLPWNQTWLTPELSAGFLVHGTW